MPPQILAIQYLRGLAASLVVIFHVGLVLGWTTQDDNQGVNAFHSFVATAVEAGEAGVDVFFVISGFVMWLVTHDRNVSPLRFMEQRFIRIAPLYWLVTVAMVAAATLRPNLFPLEEPTISHVAQSLLFIPHLSPDNIPYPLLRQGWTLNYEMFFYFLFASMLLLPRQMRVAGLTIVLMSLVLLGLTMSPAGVVALTYSSPLLLEFLAGVWLGRAWVNGSVPNVPGALVLLVGGVGLLGCHQWVDELASARALVFGVPAFLIVAGAVSIERHRKVLKIEVLRRLGDASYSIYLTHSFFMVAAGVITINLGMNMQGVVAFVAVVTVSLAGGVLCYQLLEKPLTSYIRTLSSRSDATLPVLRHPLPRR